MNTQTIIYSSEGIEHRLVVKYGFDYSFAKAHNQKPHFSITGDLFPDDLCGAIHEIIREHAPDLAHLIKWHLVSTPFEPMHYVANALYWYEHTFKGDKVHTNPLEALKETIVYGILEDDEENLQKYLVSFDKESFKEWLKSRVERADEVMRKELGEMIS